MSDYIVILNIFYKFVNLAECKCYYCIGCAVVYSDTSGSCIKESCAREAYVGNVAYALIGCFGMKDVISATVKNLPWLVLVKNCSTDLVDHAVAGLSNAVINKQPAFVNLDRDGACANLCPCPAHRLEYMMMLAPVDHVG